MTAVDKVGIGRLFEVLARKFESLKVKCSSIAANKSVEGLRITEATAMAAISVPAIATVNFSQ